MLTTHALVCDGEDCAASFVPSGRYEVTSRIDSVILSDAVHAFREARAAGWRTGIPVERDERHDLCPPCGAALAAREADETTDHQRRERADYGAHDANHDWRTATWAQAADKVAEVLGNLAEQRTVSGR